MLVADQGLVFLLRPDAWQGIGAMRTLAILALLNYEAVLGFAPV